MIGKGPLRFVFSGYSIWLEPEQCEGDLERTIATAALELAIHPIPAPHATLVYGISHMSESQVRECFKKICSRIQSWPTLTTKGLLTDVELDGVGGGEMDMAWSEVTYETSDEHEKLLDFVWDCIWGGTASSTRTTPWAPHVSLAYDNPEHPIPPEYLASLLERCPTLTKNRRMVAIGLWDTRGTIDEWKCIERIPLWSDEDDGPI